MPHSQRPELSAPPDTAPEEALVFTRTKHRTDRLQKFLVRNGIPAERIHGNRSQAQRTLALAGFKSGQHRVLVPDFDYTAKPAAKLEVPRRRP